MARPSGPYLFILLTLLIDAIGIGIVFPIMPDLMAKVGADDVAQGALWAGLLMASYAAAQFIFAPIVGSISDAYGRKPVLIAALAFLTLDYVIMALADSYWLLLVGRTLAGLAGATYVTATAYIADITPKKERAARFGMIGAAFGVGFVLGPALGGVAATWGVTAPFWVAAAISGANVVFGMLVLPESLPRNKRRAFGVREVNPFGIILRAFRIPGLPVPLVASFLFEFANMVYVTLWAFWGREVFGWSTLLIGISLSVYGILVALAQAVVMPVAVRRLGERRLTIWGLIIAALAMTGYGFTTAVWTLAILLPMAALSDLVPPTLSAIAANAADDDQQGMVQGVISSLAAIAAVTAPVVFTPVFGVFADDAGRVYLPGAPFLLAAAIVIAILPLVVWTRDGSREADEAL
ncbi:MAG: MFS transporter [Paracoccaceae bacterium]|nr:MFS transporter [Paracoccaceae bacterium]